MSHDGWPVREVLPGSPTHKGGRYYDKAVLDVPRWWNGHIHRYSRVHPGESTSSWAQSARQDLRMCKKSSSPVSILARPKSSITAVPDGVYLASRIILRPENSLILVKISSRGSIPEGSKGSVMLGPMISPVTVLGSLTTWDTSSNLVYQPVGWPQQERFLRDFPGYFPDQLGHVWNFKTLFLRCDPGVSQEPHLVPQHWQIHWHLVPHRFRQNLAPSEYD